MKVTSKLFVVALILSLILTVGIVLAAEDIYFDQSDLEAGSDETYVVKLSQEDNDLAEIDNKNKVSELSTSGGGENFLL